MAGSLVGFSDGVKEKISYVFGRRSKLSVAESLGQDGIVKSGCFQQWMVQYLLDGQLPAFTADVLEKLVDFRDDYQGNNDNWNY